MKKSLPLVFVLMLALVPLAGAQGTFKSIEINVYDTGYTKVTELFSHVNITVVVEVPLLTGDVVGLTVTDERGNPIPFEQNGSSVDVYLTESVGLINVTYFTAVLTSKEGDIWTINFSSPAPVTVHFPKGAVIVDLSDVPLAISGTSITMPPGNQSISYTLPLPTRTETSSTASQSSPTSSIPTTSSTTSTKTSSGPSTTSTPFISPKSAEREGSRSILWPIAGAIVVLVIAGVLYYALRSKPKGEVKLTVGEKEYLERLKNLDLNDDEVEALMYIYRQGGRAKQADVRKALGLPKTTAWRMFNRLSERGLVRIYKNGKENWVELNL